MLPMSGRVFETYMEGWDLGGPAVRGRSHHGGCQLSKVGYVNSCRIKYQAIRLLKVEYFLKL